LRRSVKLGYRLTKKYIKKTGNKAPSSKYNIRVTLYDKSP